MKETPKKSENTEFVTITRAEKYAVRNTISSKLYMQIIQIMGCSRKVYNLYVDFLYDYLKSINYKVGDPIPKLKLPEVTFFKKQFDYLNDADSLALSNAKIDFENAVQKYNSEYDHKTYTKRALRRDESGTEKLSFRGLKGMPKFHSKRRGYYSYKTNNQLSKNNKYSIRLNGNMLHLPKLNAELPLIMHRPLPDGALIKNVTLTKDTDDILYASICYEITVSRDTAIKEAVINNDQSFIDNLLFLGLDYSQKHFYVDSNGEKANYPFFYRQMEEKLAKEQRKLSFMEYGSKNYYKQKKKVDKIHKKIRNQRLDFINKEVYYLVSKYDVIVVEDIDLRAMGSCLSLGKNLHDIGFGIFRTKLTNKLEDKGSVLVKIDRFYPSTKTCHCCGYINKEISKSTTEWDCPDCGEHHDRDENAAINIKEEGFRIFSDYYKKHLEEQDKINKKRKATKEIRTKKKFA